MKKFKMFFVVIIAIAFGLNQASAQDSLVVNTNNANVVDSVKLLKELTQDLLSKNETLTKTIENKMLDENPGSKERFNRIFPEDSSKATNAIDTANNNKTVIENKVVQPVVVVTKKSPAKTQNASNPGMTYVVAKMEQNDKAWVPVKEKVLVPMPTKGTIVVDSKNNTIQIRESDVKPLQKQIELYKKMGFTLKKVKQ